MYGAEQADIAISVGRAVRYPAHVTRHPSETEPTVDTDGDMLTDAQEAELGTNPELADSDGDGLTDFAEVGSHGEALSANIPV